jgi:hypothetical protein
VGEWSFLIHSRKPTNPWANSVVCGRLQPISPQSHGRGGTSPWSRESYVLRSVGLRSRTATFAVIVALEGTSCAHSNPQAKELIPCQRSGRADAPLPFDLRFACSIHSSLGFPEIHSTSAAHPKTLFIGRLSY